MNSYEVSLAQPAAVVGVNARTDCVALSEASAVERSSRLLAVQHARHGPRVFHGALGVVVVGVVRLGPVQLGGGADRHGLLDAARYRGDQVLRPDDDRRRRGAVDGHGVREAHGRAEHVGRARAQRVDGQAAGHGVRGILRHGRARELGDASPHSLPSRRQARQAKPSAALDTFVSVHVRLGRATSSLSVLRSDRPSPAPPRPGTGRAATATPACRRSRRPWSSRRESSSRQ